MSDLVTTSPGKVRVTPEMVEAMLEIVRCHGQNQAGLAQYADVSPSTISGIVKGKDKPSEYRKGTWDDLIGGLKKLIQNETLAGDTDKARLNQLLSLLSIHKPRVSLPEDVLDGSWDNYVERIADIALRERLAKDQSALLRTKGGHKMGHSSLLGEHMRHGAISGAKVYSINLESELVFSPDWDAEKFYDAITSVIGMKPLRGEDLRQPLQIAHALTDRFKDETGGAPSLIAIDGLQRSIMSNDVDALRNQASVVTLLPIILNRVVDGLQRLGQGQVIFLLAGPMPYYNVKRGIHQSRLLMKEHSASFFTPDESKLLFQKLMGYEPSEKQAKSMREVLVGHPYLVHAAISDLQRGKNSLPDEPAQFCHHDSLLSLVAHLESTYRPLADLEDTLPRTLRDLVDAAQAKPAGIERTICLEIGAGIFVNAAYKTLPPLAYHYFGQQT